MIRYIILFYFQLEIFLQGPFTVVNRTTVATLKVTDIFYQQNPTKRTWSPSAVCTGKSITPGPCGSAAAVCTVNKKLRYREEHSAFVVLGWCTLWHFSGENLLMA